MRLRIAAQARRSRPHVLLHHMTLVSEPEIELIVKTDTATSYNPLASVWKGNAVAPALRFAQRGVRFGVDPTRRPPTVSRT